MPGSRSPEFLYADGSPSFRFLVGPAASGFTTVSNFVGSEQSAGDWAGTSAPVCSQNVCRNAYFGSPIADFGKVAVWISGIPMNRTRSPTWTLTALSGYSFALTLFTKPPALILTSGPEDGLPLVTVCAISSAALPSILVVCFSCCAAEFDTCCGVGMVVAASATVSLTSMPGCSRQRKE